MNQTQITFTEDTQPQTGRQADPRRWYALVIILLPMLLVLLNNYMLQVALPLIESNLHANFSEAQLIFSGYPLGMAVALIVGGKLGDIYGRKRMLSLGILVFTIMAAIGGMASQPDLLIVTRIIQGISAAMIQPQILSIIQSSFPANEKGLVFAIYGAMIGIGFTLGLILGGFLVEWNLLALGWRIVFLFHVPFGLLSLLLLPIVSESRAKDKQNVDWMGTVLLLLGLLLFVYPLTTGQKQGWPLRIWGCLLLSFLILTAFIRMQSRKTLRDRAPLIDVSIFKSFSFNIGILNEIVIYLSMFSFFFILNYYLQSGLHYDMKTTSLVFLPLGTGFFLTSLLSSRMVKRWGISVLKSGTLIMGICNFLLIGTFAADPVHVLNFLNIILLLIYGFGVGLATTPLANIVFSSVPTRLAGTGSGLFTTFMYLTNSLAVSLIGILFSSSLGHILSKASLTDYMRAFAVSSSASGFVALIGFVCICCIPVVKKEKLPNK